ncbi:MAG: class I adenylate-forming enzyme family protein [Desulfitobacteriaceae bacterium]
MTAENWEWVGDLIGQRAMLNSSREAIIDLDSGIHYTYGNLDDRANRLANYLAEKFNIQKGDRVAFISGNRIEMFDGIFACGKLGAIFVPYNIRLTPGELSKLLENEEPKILFYEEIFESAVRNLKKDLSIFMHYVVLADEELQSEQDQNKLYYAKIMNYEDNSPRKCQGLDLEDIYLLIHTGGTTGLPKGAMISHRAVLYNQFNTILDTGVNWDKTAHLILPLFHTGGWNFVTLAILKAGGRLLINRTFDTKLTLRVINEYKPNFVFAAATILRMMIDQPEFETTDWSTVEWVLSGAAPTPVQLMEKFWEKGIKIGLAYGLTEGGPTNLCIPVNFMSIKELRQKHASVGKPFSFTVAKIVGNDGREAGVEETGELIFSGPQIFSGYWRNEEETRKTLHNGWIHTGDMAKKDKDGFYYIVGRKKNMYISGGENVFPQEIETELYQIAEVHECCVIGVPDPKWGEVGKAVIALKPGESISKEQVIAYLKTRLAPYKVPKYVTFVDEIPKNSAGKIVAREVLQLYGRPQDD